MNQYTDYISKNKLLLFSRQKKHLENINLKKDPAK